MKMVKALLFNTKLNLDTEKMIAIWHNLDKHFEVKNIISLATFLLIFSNLAAQNIEALQKVIISYNGDSSLQVLPERYEIDIIKKKVFYLNPIMNYKDIKGTKYRSSIKITKAYWDEIIPLTNSIFSSFSDQSNNKEGGIITYSIDFYNDNKVIGKYHFHTDKVPNELLRLFELIRKKR